MDNIITVRNRCIEKANMAFEGFMETMERELNERALATPGLYCKCNGKELEGVTLKVMKEISSNTPFRAEEIKLVSAQNFPDIIAEEYYGVEVKSTKENHWTSTGSSIVESTRNKSVENIYMLFGKLGGNTAEFKCRPYEDCLYDIAVTHSPRYLIDMELTREQTIFSKMKIDYNKLRTSPDSIEQVRTYYRQKAKAANRREMPWWLGSSNSMNIRLWTDKENRKAYSDENRKLKAKMLILFPDILKSDYRDVALWLCSKYSIVLYNARDLFSASGQFHKVNGEEIEFPLPHVVGEILTLAADIKYLLKNPELMRSEIIEYRPDLLGENRYTIWLRRIAEDVQSLRVKNGESQSCIRDLGKIPFEEWFEKEYVLS